MTEYYAVRQVDCSPEQIEQIYSLAKASMDADSSEYYDYAPNRWEFIVFEESEQIYQCSRKHFKDIRVELITPEEAILRLFEIYLEK